MERDRRVGAVIRPGALALVTAWVPALVLASGLVACGVAGGPAGPKLAPTSNRCPAGFEEGPKGTCFSLPANADASTPTVLYVHSASNETTVAQELEVVKAALGDTMGILFARGSESECALAADVRATFCWPQPDDLASSEPIWERWDKVQWQAEALLPEGTHPRLVLGFREGAAFAARAYQRGAIHAQVMAVVAPAEKALEPGPYPGWLVGVGVPASSATLFTSSTGSSARCTRDDSRALAASDLERVLGVFHLATRPASAGEAPLAPAPCTIHVPGGEAASPPSPGNPVP